MLWWRPNIKLFCYITIVLLLLWIVVKIVEMQHIWYVNPERGWGGFDPQVENHCFRDHALAFSQMSKAALKMPLLFPSSQSLPEQVTWKLLFLLYSQLIYPLDSRHIPLIYTEQPLKCRHAKHYFLMLYQSPLIVCSCFQTWQPLCIAIMREHSQLHRDLYPRGHLHPQRI